MDKVIIMLDNDNVGELTDEGDIISDDTCLKKIAFKIKGKKLIDMRSRRDGEGELYFTGMKTGKGDKGYCDVVAELLIDEGYCIQEIPSHC